MNTIIDLVFEYKEYIGLGLLVLVVLVCVVSEKVRSQLKKGAIVLLVVSGLGLCYYFFTGKSPSDIPADINRFFNRRPAEVEPSHRYYQDRKEHYTVPAN
jgi:hypothetical protein